MNAVDLITDQLKPLTEGAIQRLPNFVAAIVLFSSIKPSSLVAGLGLGSVAIGFAFKGIFENFFAGIEIPHPYRTLTFHEPLPVQQITTNS